MIEAFKQLICKNEINKNIDLTAKNSEFKQKLIELNEKFKQSILESERLKESLGLARAMIPKNDFTEWADLKYGLRWKLLYNKRYVPNRNTVIPYSPTEFIYESEVLKRLNFKTIQDIWTHRIQYINDIKNQNYNEFWQFPEESTALGCGDCEDSSIFRVSASRTIGLTNTAVALGYYKGTGHAFPVMLKNGSLYILEATSNNYYETPSTSADYDIHWLFNEDGLWRVKDGAVSFASIVDGKW